jgi:hypothetical protein
MAIILLQLKNNSGMFPTDYREVKFRLREGGYIKAMKWYAVN